MTATLSLIPGGVATPLGFRAAGISAGIKASGNPDLALLVADAPAQVAAVITTNKVIAAPVLVSQEHLARSGGTVRAIVVNSGCANACTGDAGM
ncbi:MAG: glutamate N-acetyltransferase / amino-acid N-acetyltransferase, partial [Pseudonocardiales bacterium]|nr:glutamate N-acetyltransferase / amino-acid N-acetyltransferase [Pseudonocardiales bacterium]